MKSIPQLPEGYIPTRTIDLQNNKKAALTVHIIALLVFVLVIVGGLLAVPITALLPVAGTSLAGTLFVLMLKFVAILLGVILYCMLQGLLMGLSVRVFGGAKVRFEMTGLYFCASSSAYFGRSAYIATALAPYLLWEILFAAGCFFIPTHWFWVVYFLLALNMANATVCIYSICVLLRQPAGILIHDHGASMTIYEPIK